MGTVNDRIRAIRPMLMGLIDCLEIANSADNAADNNLDNKHAKLTFDYIKATIKIVLINQFPELQANLDLLWDRFCDNPEWSVMKELIRDLTANASSELV